MPPIPPEEPRSESRENARGVTTGGASDPSDAGLSRLAAAADEFLERRRRGEAVDRRAFLAEHADVADALERCLDGLELIRVARDAPDAVSGAERLLPSCPSVSAKARVIGGDYRLIRQLGRGGMGVVYEAEQLSLRRRVALKVLPGPSPAGGGSAGAPHPGQRALARFRVEVLAAAQLHHPSIVPVYASGADGDLHFYAMQLIDGCTLAEVIERLREAKPPGTAAPAPTIATAPGVSEPGGEIVARHLSADGSASGRAYVRAVARLGIQAAEALEHAHLRGVIHRDVKPSNLLLDRAGQLWVTDFGLASFRQAQEETLTQSGDVVGTLRYSSPEQALVTRTPVDHRTDIYALGVTLYELLTLRPAYDGESRGDILEGIARGEPPPPRTQNPAISADLETVVLKAMAREVHDRYATARELAEDLQRFLEDRPILARRPTALQRAGKWSRRHQSLVWSAAAMLAVALAALAVTTVLVWREKQRADAALAQSLRSQRLEEQQRRRAEQERARAEQNLGMAMQALDEVYQRTWRPAAMEPIERELLLKVAGFYERFAAANADSDQLVERVAAGLERAGSAYWWLGYEAESRRAREKYREVARRLGRVRGLEGMRHAVRHENDTDVLGQFIGWSVVEFGELWTSGRVAEAAAFARERVDAAERLLELRPESDEAMLLVSAAHTARAPVLVRWSDFESAEAGHRRAVAAAERAVLRQPRSWKNSKTLAGAREAYAAFLRALGRYGDAEAMLRQAIAAYVHCASTNPRRFDIPLDLAEARCELASLLEALGRSDEALPEYDAAIRGYEQIVENASDAMFGVRGAADVQAQFARSLWKSGRLPEAEQVYRRFLASYREAPCRDESLRRIRQRRLLLHELELSQVLSVQPGREHEARAIYYGAMSGLEAAAVDASLAGETWVSLTWRVAARAELGDWPGAADDLARVAALAPQRKMSYLSRRGVALLAGGDLDGYRDVCRELLDAAAACDPGPAAGDPLDAPQWLWTCALASAALEDPSRAVELAEQLFRSLRTHGAPVPDAELVTGALLYRADRPAEAVEVLQAVLGPRNAAGSVPNARGYRRSADPWFFLAMSLHRVGRTEDAQDAFATAIQVSEDQQCAGPPLHWVARASRNLLRCEAEALIGPPAATPPRSRPAHQAAE